MLEGYSFAGSEEDPLATLQSQILALRTRVQELEAENAELLSQVAGCKCKQIDSRSFGSLSVGKRSIGNFGKVKAADVNSTENKPRHKRYIALKVMYFGQRFYGFASEAHMDPTIESEIFKALKKTRLLVGDKKDSQYSRCGRTDKGVSSIGQVIALFVRSKLREAGDCASAHLEMPTVGEIDYVRVLNHALPDDIRILGWCPIPSDFSARFSCLGREYKYFFWRENLDLLAMENAGKKLIGEHDFRNFCKMDATNVHNYKRFISSFEVSTCHNSCEGDELCAITIKGTAFLWHQVRCMVAVLFMIGQGVESVNVIDTLLDTDKMTRKPQYAMASEIPLVLHACNFEDLKFICSSGAKKTLCAHLKNEWLSYQLRSSIFYEALLSCSSIAEDGNTSNYICMKKKPSHVPLLIRPVEPSYEERRAKLTAKQRLHDSEVHQEILTGLSSC